MKRDPLENLIIGFVVLNLLALLSGCARLEVGFTKRDIPLTRFYTYTPYVDLELGEVSE